MTATDPRESYLSECPLIVTYADTGAGKTYLAATLVPEPRYRPLLLIDVDLGAETMAAFAGRPELVNHRKYAGSESAMDMIRWVEAELRAAHDKPCGSIVIEGIGKIYSMIRDELIMLLWKSRPTMSAAEFQKQLTGNGGRALYQTGAALTSSLLASVDKLKRARRAHTAKGAPGVPIIVTLTTRTSLKNDVDVSAPGLSKNLCMSLMSSADMFLELTRVGAVTQLHTMPDGLHPHRKVRNPVAAAAIAALQNPTLPDVINAAVAARATTNDYTDQMLAAERDNQQQPET